MKKLLLLILPVILILELNGCAPSKPAEKVRLISPDRLIKKLEANRRKIKTFIGTGTLTINSPIANATSKFEIMIKKPDSMKVSFFGPFGIDLAQILITPQYFQFYDIINNTLYRGRMRDDIMKLLLKVDLSFYEVIDALAGSVNLTDKLRIEPDSYEVQDNLYKLTYNDSLKSIRQSYFIDSGDLAIVQNLVTGWTGQNLLEGKYSHFKHFEEVPIPFQIQLADVKNHQKMKVEYGNVEVNEPANDFKISLPNDVKVVEW